MTFPLDETSAICRISSEMKRISAFLMGIFLVFGIAADTFAADSDPVRKIDPLLERDRAHDLSIFSYMRPAERRLRSVPVLVTLNIVGPEGLKIFCEYRPRISEAVLNVLSDEHASFDDEGSIIERKTDLANRKKQMLQAVNYVLPGQPVSGLDVMAGRRAAQFGPEIAWTNKTCRKLDSLVR